MDAPRLKLTRVEIYSALAGLAIGSILALALYGLGELLWALFGSAA